MTLYGLFGLIVSIAGGVGFYWLLSLGDNDYDDKTDRMG